MKIVINLKINGRDRELLVKPNETLAQVLRGPQLNLTGTKQACELGDCGA
jgi:aerobic-type carbon monoxide dehydrogenase small subunit (CoxS/CutS family)